MPRGLKTRETGELLLSKIIQKKNKNKKQAFTPSTPRHPFSGSPRGLGSEPPQFSLGSRH